jgi:hypothetical protein
MMDTGTQRVFDSFCDQQNIDRYTRQAMHAEFISDPEYWGNESLWKLYDRCRLHSVTVPTGY